MYTIDNVNDRHKGENREVEYFNNNPGLRVFFEILPTIASCICGLSFSNSLFTLYLSL